MNDEEAPLPSWMVEGNDEKHKQGTAAAPLFGSGALNLLDANPSPLAPPSTKSTAAQEHSQQQETTSTNATSYGSTDVTTTSLETHKHQKNKKQNKKKKERTEEQAKREITSLAEAFGRMQHKKQETEENRRLFTASHETAKDSHDGDETAASSSTKGKSKKTDHFGPIDSHSHDNSDEEQGEEEEDEDDEEKRALLLKEQLKPHVPPQNACLWFFHAVEGFCVVALLCLIATQVIPVVVLYRDYPNDWWTQIGIFSLALKVYISIFSLVFILVELSVPLSFLRTSNLLRNFITRGWIYSFVGLVATSEAYQEHVQNAISSGAKARQSLQPADSLASVVPWEAIFMQVSAWVMLGIGLLYMFLGICCLQPLYERLRDKERQDWQKYHTDYKAWKALYKK